MEERKDRSMITVLMLLPPFKCTPKLSKLLYVEAFGIHALSMASTTYNENDKWYVEPNFEFPFIL